MATPHASSSTSVRLPKGLDWFSEIPLNTNVEERVAGTYQPIQNSDPFSGTIDFEVNCHDLFLDPTQLYLDVKVTLKAKDGTTFAATDTTECAPVGTGGAMFSQVQLFLNQTKISSGDHYGYLSYLESLCCHGSDEKSTSLVTQGFYPSFDDWALKTEFTTATVRTLNYYLKLNTPFCSNPRLLPSNSKLTVRLTRARPEFYIQNHSNALPADLDGKELGLHIDDIKLHAVKYKLNPTVSLEMERLLSLRPAVFAVRRSQITTATLQKSVSLQYLRNVYSGPCPLRLILGFVPLKNFAGDLKTNPFDFALNGVGEVILMKNDDKVHPSFEVSVPNAIATYPSLVHGSRVYTEFSNVIGLKAFQSLGITPKQFFKHNCLYAYDLSRSSANNLRSKDPSSICTLGFQIRFNTAPASELVAIIYTEHSSTITIDSFRSVTTDV